MRLYTIEDGIHINIPNEMVDKIDKVIGELKHFLYTLFMLSKFYIFRNSKKFSNILAVIPHMT